MNGNHESKKSCEGQEKPEGKGQWTSSMPLDQGNSNPGKTNVLEASKTTYTRCTAALGQQLLELALLKQLYLSWGECLEPTRPEPMP